MKHMFKGYLILFAMVLGVCPFSFAAENPPDDVDNSTNCVCCKNGDKPLVENNSVSLNVPCGSLAHGSIIDYASLSIEEQQPSSMTATPQALNLNIGDYMIKSVRRVGLDTEIEVRKGSSRLIFLLKYHVSEGGVVGSNVGAPERIRRISSTGSLSFSSYPASYDLMVGNGDVYRFSAGLESGYNLKSARISGRTQVVGSMGLDIVSDSQSPTIVRQVKTPSRLLDVVVDSPTQYRIDTYSDDFVGSLDANGVYEIISGAFAMESVVVQNPEGTNNLNHLTITERIGWDVDEGDYSTKRTNHFTYVASRNEWTLSKDGVSFNRFAKEVAQGSDTKISTRVIGQYAADGSEIVHYKKETTKSVKTWGTPVTQIKEYSAAGVALVTDYTYYEDEANDDGFGKKATMTRSDGYSVSYQYYGDAPDEHLKGLLHTKTVPWRDSSKTITYTYDEDAIDANNDRRPRTITETTESGVEIKKTEKSYLIVSDILTETTDRYFSETESLETIKIHYSTVASTEVEKGRLHTVQHSDGRKDTYVYEKGTLAAVPEAAPTDWEDLPQASDFTPDSDGDALRTTITHGIVASPSGIANKTTRERTVKDVRGYVVARETQAFVGGTSYETIDWKVIKNDNLGHPTITYYSDGTLDAGEWGTGCCGKDNGTDRHGIKHVYTYDAYGRMESSTKKKGENNDITTSSGYDGKGRRVSSSTTVDSAEYFSTTTDYDWRGRITSRTDEQGLVTSAIYTCNSNTATRTEITTFPGDGTRIVVKYADGKIKSISGTATVAEYHEYGITDGKQWNKVSLGSSTDATDRWIKTTYDMLGRVESVERPGYGTGVVLKTLNEYNTKGQLWQIEKYTDDTLTVRTTYKYDEMGDREYVCMDIDLDNTTAEPDLDSSDRITKYETVYSEETIDEVSYWFLVTTAISYPFNSQDVLDGIATAIDDGVTVSIQKVRLTGFDTVTAPTGVSGVLVSESSSKDVHGNETISQTWVDRASKTVTQITDVPTSTEDQISITINGLLDSVSTASSASSVVHSFEYDAVERRTKGYDPRTKGTDPNDLHHSETHYNALGQVDYTKDAASHQTDYGYDSDTGQLVSVTDPNDNTVNYVYNLLGQKTGEWGDTYPVIYKYDQYGQMTDLYTHRGSATDPVNTEAEFNALVTDINATTGDSPDLDRTHWGYDPATGLLLDKRYAYKASDPTASKGPDYIYYSNGQLNTRKWARDAAGTVTTYTYYDNAGELKNIDYPGSTEDDVSFTYDRLGRQKTVDDRQGTRTFGYTAKGLLDTETLKTDDGTTTLHVLDHSQQTAGEGKGRNTGFALSIAGSSAQTITYDYDGYGRFKTVESSVVAIPNPLTSFVEYIYVDNSNLVGGYTAGATETTYPKLAVAKTYEPDRNLIYSVENKKIASQGATPTVHSSFTYINDDAGRRTKRTDVRSGTVVNDFGYNDRNEVTSTTMVNGTHAYGFDNIGNRLESSHVDTDTPPNTSTVTYAPNALNQYKNDDNVTGAIDHEFDDDGNLEDDGTWRYVWNAENRLVEMRTYHEPDNPLANDVKLTFAYDFMGRRYEKKVHLYNTATPAFELQTTTTFFYNGWNMIHEVTKNASDVVTSTKSHVWGLDLSQTLQGAGGVGGLLSTVISDGTASAYYSTTDANGNITDYIDESGTVVASYTYDAFGKTITETGNMVSDFTFRFSSKYWDSETDLNYYGYRYYSAEQGRWLNRDPKGEAGGKNLYAFNYNSPIRYIDPDGRAPQLVGINPDGSGIYGPDRDWGDYDPLWGGRGRPMGVGGGVGAGSPCDGYNSLFGAKCKDERNCDIDDPYPETAQGFCEGFLDMYRGKLMGPSSRCVARCLVQDEENIQKNYTSCKARASARFGAHGTCYAKCVFIPNRGVPKGAWRFGASELWPVYRDDIINHFPLLPGIGGDMF